MHLIWCDGGHCRHHMWPCLLKLNLKNLYTEDPRKKTSLDLIYRQMIYSLNIVMKGRIESWSWHQFNQPKDYGLIVELPFPPQYWIFLVAFPNSTWLTRLANWREHKLSLLLSIVGLRLTNISTLPSPLKQSWRRYVSKELRNGTCFNPWPSLWRHRLNSSDSCWWLVFPSDAVHHLPRHSDQVVRIPPSHMGSWSVELEIIVIPF